MRVASLILLAIFGLSCGCAQEEPTAPTGGEVIFRPEQPAGPDSAAHREAQRFSTSGGESSLDHPTQYRFDFDAERNHRYTEWQDSAAAWHLWSEHGTYVIKSRARCAIHRDVVSTWSPGKTVNIGERIAPPQVLTGSAFTDTMRTGEYCARGATSNLRHPLEFQIDFDADENHDTSEWGRSCRSHRWSTSGLYIVKSRARCAIHPYATSPWSDGKVVAVDAGPDIEIFLVLNAYVADGREIVEPVDFNDGVPDTVPYESWITFFYRGRRNPNDPTPCEDEVNECIRFQTAFERFSDEYPPGYARSQWLPAEGQDTNPFGPNDSTSMNIGTVDYNIMARTVSQDGRAGMPAVVQLEGNLAPSLDDFSLESNTGCVAAGGGELVWDWWRPANPDTLVTDPDNPHRKKEFFFVIKAAGHDHPKERRGSGVKSWFYRFFRTDNPAFEQVFARSGSWVEGARVDALSDTFRYTFIYPFADIQGDSVFAHLPPWMDREYEFDIVGRDTPLTEDFSQYMFVNGTKRLINCYETAPAGRRTPEGSLRFTFTMRR